MKEVFINFLIKLNIMKQNFYFTVLPKIMVRKALRPFLFLFIMTLGISLSAQIVKGTVKDADTGETLIGASIIEVNTNNGTTSDLDGNFAIRVSSTNATLKISYIGYNDVMLNLEGKTQVDVKLSAGAQLEEVVVTALGISREKKALSYSAQQVNSDELNAVKDANVINSLTGKAAGVFINKSMSGTGGSTKVLLRGNSSTRNNQPLYVIDGIPVYNYSTSQPTSVWGASNSRSGLGRDGGDAISNINSEDIESISILKGASAAALYGSQAANGAILITTKKGAEGKTSVTFSSNFTVENPLLTPDLQYTYGQTTAGSRDSWGDKLSTPAADHVSDFFETGKTWINSITMSGGSKVAQTYLSYANTKSNSILPTSDFTKHNLMLKETAKFFNDKLDVNASINYITQKGNNRPTAGLYFNPLTGLYFFPRGLDFNTYKNEYEVFDKTRNTNVQNWTANKDVEQNPYWILNRNKNFDTRNRIFSTIGLNYKLTEKVNIMARGNIDKTYDQFDQRSYASTQGAIADHNGRYLLQNDEATQYYGDVILNYKNNFGDLSFTGNVGSSITDTKKATDAFDSKGTDLKFANVFSMQNMNQSGTQYYSRKQLQSVFGSLQFGYNNFLYFDVTGRNDWSSSFANTSTNSYFYPSFGVSAILSEMFNVPSLNFAKFRASYAIVGNDVDAYVTNLSHSINPVTGLMTNTIGVLPGTELQPEKSKSLEFGLDLRFLDNKLNFDITYYKSNTENQFVSISAPAGSGFSKYLVNAGNIENKGWEALIGYTPIKTKNLEWNTSLNFTKNKNTVLELHEGLSDGIFFLTDAGVNSYAMVIKEGSSFGDIYGKVFKRDANGVVMADESGKPLPDGFGYIGNPNPDFMMGFNNTFTMGSLSFKFLIDGRFGGEVMSITQAMIDELGVSQATADARDNGGVDFTVVKPDGSTLNKIDANVFYQGVAGRAGITENYVYDASNVRLRELAIGYTIPASMTKMLGSSTKLKVSLVGRNLFFLMNKAPFDPDVSMSTGVGLQGVDVFSIPSTRSFGVNITANF